MRWMTVPVLMMVLYGPAAPAQDFSNLVSQLRGAKLIAQDGEKTFLGTFSNRFQRDSIFNEFGPNGSEFSGTSIWNKFCPFGSEFSQHSPNNQFTGTPPMIVKNGKIIGYLTRNKLHKGALNPGILKALVDEF